MSWRGIKVFGQVALCLIGLGGPANALTVTDIVGPGLGNALPLNPSTEYDYTSPKILGGTTFTDIFYFNPSHLTGPAVGEVLASFLPPPAGSFTSLKLSWWQDNAPVGKGLGDVKLATLPVLAPVTTGPLVLALVAGTNYFLEVDGTVAKGPHKGTYDFSLTTTPLPPALVLFGSALAGLTLLGRRSRPRTPNALG